MTTARREFLVAFAATNGNVVPGNERFEEQIAKMLKRRVTRGKAGGPGRRADEGKRQSLL
jgi:hypothetical protein